VVAWGDSAAIAERVRQFHDAGADHVCIQVVADRAAGFPLRAYREVRSALPGR
jgi:2-methylisocitrate lyase-like PEP mutase family enzyme